MTDEFGARFIQDVDRLEGSTKMSLASLKKHVPSSVLKKGMSMDDRRLAYSKIDSSRRSKFSRLVYAEMFDSIHCHSASVSQFEEMKSSDPSRISQAKTEEEYMQLIGAGEAIDEIIKGLGTETSSSLSLWGRWGRGNGPIRQGFRNWGNWRRQGRGFFNARRYNRGSGWIFRNRIFR